MPKIKALKESLSRKRPTESTDSNQKISRWQKATRSASIYLSIDELPIIIFWKICVSGDLSLLIKDSSNFGIDELLTAWEEIGFQYADVMDQGIKPENKYEFNAVALRFRVNLVAVAIEALKIKQSEKVISVLQKLFKDLPFDYNDPEGFNRDIIRAIGLSKNWQVEYMQLEGIISKGEGEKMNKAGKNTLAYYYQSLTPLKKYLGMRPDPNIYTVLEYCVDVKALIQENTALKKAAEKNARSHK